MAEEDHHDEESKQREGDGRTRAGPRARRTVGDVMIWRRSLRRRAGITETVRQGKGLTF